MTLATVDHGPRWDWLKREGWVIRPGMTRATAEVDAAHKLIRVKPEAFYRPSRRTRLFVIQHEIVHALHSTLDYAVGDIRLDLDLTPNAAMEAVANAALWRDGSREMRGWVLTSVAYHQMLPGGRYRYRLRDLSHPTVLAMVDRVLAVADPSTR